MRACPPKWKWLFATLQRYNVKHKHNQGKRVANGIACSKEGGNATSTLHSRGSPNNGGQNQKSKAPLGVTMMPLGAPSISKYGSLVRQDAQIVALCAHCARTSRALRLRRPPYQDTTTGVHVLRRRCGMADIAFFKCTTCRYFSIDQLESPTIPRRLYDEVNPDPVFPREGTWQHDVTEQGDMERNP